ncbi:MAG TPA: phosphoribosylanthranilate isomerase [Candidatus Methanoperedens sp.]|nr:phosphoribosylanthranilate isomerase [Candidatus Methanoperedens sp.]
MEPVKVKICGLMNLADAHAAAAAGADLLGFVFAAGPRRLDPRAARGFWGELPRGACTVAVFRDQSVGEVERVLAQVRPDYLQFHGAETPGFCRLFGLPVIRALSARAPGDLALAAAFLDVAEFFLVDLPKGDAGALAAEVARTAAGLPRPAFLAGGLTPGTVRAVVERFRPYGVDVARGVESSPGRKDHVLVREFVRMAKSAAASA